MDNQTPQPTYWRIIFDAIDALPWYKLFALAGVLNFLSGVITLTGLVPPTPLVVGIQKLGVAVFAFFVSLYFYWRDHIYAD